MSARGGVIVFHEIDWAGIASNPSAPTHDRACDWAVQTLCAHGTETRMGTKLPSVFVAAGLPAPRMRLEALIAGGTNSHDRLQLVADLVRTLLPEMERLGVATAADVGIDTLVERMSEEVLANSSVVVGHYQARSWSRS